MARLQRSSTHSQGGGSIPLEAQRLGLKAIAADLNPVAVMINKAMIEIPAKFANRPPVNPESEALIDTSKSYRGAQGLAEDIAYYGKLLKKLAFEKIGHLYPKVYVPELKTDATVIAWLWARTVKCPNPACGCEMPLVNSFWLSKKKGKEVYLEPIIDGNKITYEVRKGVDCAHEGTVNRNGAICIACGSKVELKYIRDEGKAGRMSAQMIAIVAEGKNGRIYLPPNEEHINIANVDKPFDVPYGVLCGVARKNVSLYGFENFSDLFTNRQLVLLTTFSDLISNVVKKIENYDYSKAIILYLAFLIDKLADRGSSICSWDNTRDGLRNTFGRQAIPMTWDYAEGNPFSNSSGCFDNMIDWIVKCIKNFSASSIEGVVQRNAIKNAKLLDDFPESIVVSTDPPYYDNISYADISDFFYVWLRYNLENIYPEISNTIQTPKKFELIVSPYRHDGNKQKAKEFFEEGMELVFENINEYSSINIPITIYYAFKQKDMDIDGEASSGWETMLEAIIRTGFIITGTWPMRTEMANRSVGQEANALASSIVLVCRKRDPNSGSCTQKNFRRELKEELQTSLDKMQKTNIAPVDMAQSAIGPGISVYSRYEQVIDAEGNPITVRDALKLINAALDEYFNGQGERLDAASQFCVDLFAQNAFNYIKFGEADVLARAKNISTDELVEIGAILSSKGKVRLMDRDEMPLFTVDEDKRKHVNQNWIQSLNNSNCSWLWVQSLVEYLDVLGFEGCAIALRDFLGSDEMLKNLAYRLYQISEKKNWAKEGTGYNNLIVSWPDILSRRTEISHAEQQSLF